MANNHVSFLHSLFGEGEEPKRKILKSIKAKSDSRRRRSEKIADWMTSRGGSIQFLVANATLFILWIIVNTGLVKGVPVFDPYPFIFLTTFVSLEAIILAIFVLISQNRAVKIDDLREEVDLQVNLIAQKEITKVMRMLAILLQKQGVDLSEDPELKKLLRPISEEEIEKKLEKEIL
jgi:uncharacterized membrane protein